ncbi:phosphotransferase family protein [Alicyclobacillus acidocaldarius]|uniref:Aminoglycoside phosphotransferase n=1 Tax=Alicyclobacillus acidocaldarius subsp. acidocaldarius (strain ATCC 27009 / DSM 446 / BCRC 14685 / JCM 5260 / KCTC 1825 / NBRC 15652 / NCIMB 11725 / NRRL B-14509 / 104-IA) TaxID=521098 RepID=C8WQP9_ALIAD|nr:phosphotransferase family protein [Alicyclobacillus acidocaldarius]ACV57227.1 aminoglycoside phosphotransferase [Alicyclobacillus acidocaldarius subsp. acidocaldarius DSM 446]
MDIRTVPGIMPVREEDQLDWEELRKYLVREGVLPADSGPLIAVQFPTGASNLTYLIQSGEFVAVLRRPPHGPLPPRAHDMGRESSILARLHPHFPKAPKPYAYCEDPLVIGVPFFVMEYRPGVPLDDAFPEGFAYAPEVGRAISERAIQALAELHAVDPVASGLIQFGKPEGFLRRQVDGWIERFHRSRTDEDVPHADAVMAWLSAHVPESRDVTVIHNDFKLNNMLFAPPAYHDIVGIVDWEMATVGDPLFDLGVMLSYWTEPSDPPALQALFPSVTTLEGFYSRREMAERYAEETGRSVHDMKFYYVFGVFKLAVILQQIYVRYKMGKTSDARFARFGDGIRALVEHARAEIDHP